jgi:hypothetical protein
MVGDDDMAKITAKQAREIANKYISEVNEIITNDAAEGGSLSVTFADTLMMRGYIRAMEDFDIMSKRDLDTLTEKLFQAQKSHSTIKKFGER